MAVSHGRNVRVSTGFSISASPGHSAGAQGPGSERRWLAVRQAPTLYGRDPGSTLHTSQSEYRRIGASASSGSWGQPLKYKLANQHHRFSHAHVHRADRHLPSSISCYWQKAKNARGPGTASPVVERRFIPGPSCLMNSPPPTRQRGPARPPGAGNSTGRHRPCGASKRRPTSPYQ